MSSRVLLIASATGLCLAAPLGAADLASDARAFGAREAVAEPDMSADGSSVIYITPGPGRMSVAVVGNLDSGQFAKVASSDGNPESLRWCNFASATRSVCRITGTVRNNLFELLNFGRLISLNNDGSDPKLLGQKESFYDAWIRSVDAAVVDWLQGTENKVLMERLYVPEEGRLNTRLARTKSGVGVDRVDVQTLVAEPVEPPRENVGSYMSDGRGNVRLMAIPETEGRYNLSGRFKYLYRTPGSREWKVLGTHHYEDFEALAVDSDANQLYVKKKKDGRFALYAIRLDGSLSETLVAQNPRVDIDDVVRFGDGQRVIGYTFAEDKRSTVYFDPEFKALAASLGRALPNLPLIGFVDSSRDARKLLIHAGSDRDPGRYYVFDRDRKALTPAMIDRPELEGRTLATMKPVTIAAPDGAAVPAYLTLPPGKPEKGLPAVVLPHGGPSARDEWGFDWLAQFLAARGYAVLQPQFRGSAGFGDAWLNDNGFKNWRTSIGDITASAQWLAAQGIADANRMAIVGWSYGGYAALLSAATEPALYKAVVAIAPVTDLPTLKDDFRDYSISGLVNRMIGTGPHVFEGSPARRAADIRAPVLMFHGDLDTNVKIAHAEKMDSALKGAGRQSELVTFKGLDHQLRDSDARAQMLIRIGQLLERQIGQ